MTKNLEVNSPEWKVKILTDKSLKNGDSVGFMVENQSCYFGPTIGVLILDPKDPYILCDHDGKEFAIEINEYLGAYINTIYKRLNIY